MFFYVVSLFIEEEDEEEEDKVLAQAIERLSVAPWPANLDVIF